MKEIKHIGLIVAVAMLAMPVIAGTSEKGDTLDSLKASYKKAVGKRHFVLVHSKLLMH